MMMFDDFVTMEHQGGVMFTEKLIYPSSLLLPLIRVVKVVEFQDNLFKLIRANAHKIVF